MKASPRTVRDLIEDISSETEGSSELKLHEQYGSVYTLYFGSAPNIVICGYEAVKEALVDQNDDFGARGELPVGEITKGYGISMSNGERWRIMRTFTFKTLRDFGFGNMEWKIQEEVRCVVQELRKCQGRPLNPSKHVMQAFSNILCSILFGDRYDYSDAKFSKLLYIVKEIFWLASSPCCQVHSILPTLMNCIPGPHHKVITLSEELAEFVTKIVKSCQQTLEPSKPRHFVDCFLIKIEKEKNDPNTEFTRKNLMCIVHNLFLAGIETLSCTLRHALLIFLKYPEIEAKLHEEIDRVVGRDRIPNMDDKLKMPYTQAVIHEVQRFCDIAPFNVPHMTTKDTLFRGYSIPKGTNVYFLLCTVHRDPTQFATPYKFNPNHFLDDNGKFKKNDANMPFSAGKRTCPGQGVARMELFIFLTTILQNFKLTSNREFSEDDLAPKFTGFLNTPIQYELSFIPR
ncbi:cytochrome P450 2G1-like [Pyxicephalus adspersus]|uniref:cytochrome P450 2G1-like n=1 Tax=Pyxicephalus adspersus TaxID=30357 RepID=UPI003B5C1BBE